jgi:hypothetical protein
MAEQSGWKSRLEDKMISVRWWERPADMCGQSQHVGRAELPVQLRIELYLDNPFFFFEKVALPVRSAGVLVGGRQLTGIDAEIESESDEVRWGRGWGWFGGIQDSGRSCESEECSQL